MKPSLTTTACLLCCIFLLGGCAGFVSEEVGTYNCVKLQLEENCFEVQEVYSLGCTLQLEQFGQAWLTLDGVCYYGRWRAEDGSLTLDVGGELSTGQITHDICRLKLKGSELVHVFVREGTEYRDESPAKEETQPLSQEQLFWNGDWYGLWQISGGTGSWLDQSGQFFDCFGRFQVNADGKASMIFWDELQSAQEPIAEVGFVLQERPDGNPVLLSTEGWFLRTPIHESDWRIDPDAFRYDSCFLIENGHYEGEEGSFDYRILLRPWGRTWEDVEDQEPNILPYFYYDWYLPALSAGEEMPDEFHAPDTTVIRDFPMDEQTESEE